jgi:hypothetical protein
VNASADGWIECTQIQGVKRETAVRLDGEEIFSWLDSTFYLLLVEGAHPSAPDIVTHGAMQRKAIYTFT